MKCLKSSRTQELWKAKNISTFTLQTEKKLCEKQQQQKKKAGGNLSTFWQKKKLVTLISLCISFSFPVFCYSALAYRQTYVPGVRVSCLVRVWVPNGATALRKVWRCHSTPNIKSVCCHQPQQMANPTRNILFPVLHLPLPCNHSQENSACPEKGEGAENIFA